MDVSESEDICFVCYKTGDTENIIKCEECSLTVHGKCYGCSSKLRKSDEWKCRYCAYNHNRNIDASNTNYCINCRICDQNVFGALKPCANDKGFAHLVCALWTPFTYIRNQYHYSPIYNIEKCIQLSKYLCKLKCVICNKNHATIKCRVKKCKMYYHPICLLQQRNEKCMISQETQIGTMKTTMYYVYCPNHAHLHKAYDPNKITKAGREAVFSELCDDKHSDSDNDVTIMTTEVSNKQKNEIQDMSISNPNEEKKCDEINRNNNITSIIFNDRNSFDDTEMSIDENTTTSLINNIDNSHRTMFDDTDSVFNANYLHRSPFGRESSPFTYTATNVINDNMFNNNNNNNNNINNNRNQLSLGEFMNRNLSQNQQQSIQQLPSFPNTHSNRSLHSNLSPLSNRSATSPTVVPSPSNALRAPFPVYQQLNNNSSQQHIQQQQIQQQPNNNNSYVTFHF